MYNNCCEYLCKSLLCSPRALLNVSTPPLRLGACVRTLHCKLTIIDSTLVMPYRQGQIT